MRKGRVILKHRDGHLESLRCRSKERAKQIAEKRPSVIEWNFYEDGQRIPEPKKKEIEHSAFKQGITAEELEAEMRARGMLKEW